MLPSSRRQRLVHSCAVVTVTISSLMWLLSLLLLIVSPLDAFSSPWSSSSQQQRHNTRSTGSRLSINRRNTIQSQYLRLRLKMSLQDDDGSERAYEPMDEYNDDEIFFGGGGGGNGDDDDEGGNPKKRKLIEITSQIELPFSAEIAYDAYSDLPRQSSWSSWLESVVVLNDNVNNDNDNNDDDDDDDDSDNNKVESRWTSKMMGFRYSWTAVAVKNERPHTIQWRSTTGLRNEGVVRFYKKEGSTYDDGPTLMTLKMAFVAPRAVSSIIRRSKKLSKYVEEKMIAQSLKEFRDTVLENDVVVKSSASAAKTKIESTATEPAATNRVR